MGEAVELKLAADSAMVEALARQDVEARERAVEQRQRASFKDERLARSMAPSLSPRPSHPALPTAPQRRRLRNTTSMGDEWHHPPPSSLPPPLPPATGGRAPNPHQPHTTPALQPTPLNPRGATERRGGPPRGLAEVGWPRQPEWTWDPGAEDDSLSSSSGKQRDGVPKGGNKEVANKVVFGTAPRRPAAVHRGTRPSGHARKVCC